MFMRNVTSVATALAVCLVAVCIGASMPVCAGSLVYHPVNPTFGGNPLNGTPLLSQAQAQGEGVKSGPQGPDLSGLNNALGNLGSGAVSAETAQAPAGTERTARPATRACPDLTASTFTGIRS